MIFFGWLQSSKVALVLKLWIKIFAHWHVNYRMWTWCRASTSQWPCVLLPYARLPLMEFGIWFVCTPDRINYTPIPTCAAWCQSRSQHKLYKPANEESHSHPANSIAASWTGNARLVQTEQPQWTDFCVVCLWRWLYPMDKCFHL